MTQSEFFIMSPNYQLYNIKIGEIVIDAMGIGCCNVWINNSHYVINCIDKKSLQKELQNLIRDLDLTGVI